MCDASGELSECYVWSDTPEFTFGLDSNMLSWLSRGHGWIKVYGESSDGAPGPLLVSSDTIEHHCSPLMGVVRFSELPILPQTLWDDVRPLDLESLDDFARVYESGYRRTFNRAAAVELFESGVYSKSSALIYSDGVPIAVLATFTPRTHIAVTVLSLDYNFRGRSQLAGMYDAWNKWRSGFPEFSGLPVLAVTSLGLAQHLFTFGLTESIKPFCYKVQ